jgi:nitrite reductase/ring-hydroxylating ferredoxin subunit/uncharacterized membrane protein
VSIKRWIQGEQFKIPSHVALVHYPIALFTLSFLFDIADLAIGSSGWLFNADIRADHPAKRTATTHMILNLTAVGIFIIDFLLRLNGTGTAPVGVFPFILSLVGLGILLVSGFLGGRLVYYNGIGVGRYRRKTETPVRTIEVPPSGEFTPVAPENALDDGETLRVEVNGEVMTIAKLQGEYFAFNEFCTHRFGPLSEGAFSDHQVECPWHRSCFDVRTGKVVMGPAKIDLKTYEVEARDGQIFVRVPE